MNDYPIVGIYSYGEIDLLLAEDMTKVLEDEVLSINIDVDVEVLKLSHYGIDNSSSEMWLKAISPEFAIISVNKENEYNLIDKKVIERLKKLMIPYLKIDEVGTITTSSDGVTFSFSY